MGYLEMWLSDKGFHCGAGFAKARNMIEASRLRAARLPLVLAKTLNLNLCRRIRNDLGQSQTRTCLLVDALATQNWRHDEETDPHR